MDSKQLRELTITIDHLPYRELSPNNREHWAVKARAVRAAREEIGWLAKAQGWSSDDKPMEQAVIRYHFYVDNNRRRDMDNLIASCKPWQDGLIEVGVFRWDDAQHLLIGACEMTVGAEDKTVIVVQEVKA